MRSKHRGFKLAALPAGLLLLALVSGLPGSNVALAAKNVGVAAAVLPQVNATAPDQEARVLRIGLDIVADERVVTDANGKLQLLFLDGSALTVGPNSDVVVDKFVYDPDAEVGTLTFSATKGLFRLVGGKISKKTPVLLKTPHAIIGIRGGIVTANANDAGAAATFHFGQQMTVESGGVTVAANRPGFRISARAGQTPDAPVAAGAQQLAAELNALESSTEQADASNVDVGDEDVANTQLAALGSDAQSVAAVGTDTTTRLAVIDQVDSAEDDAQQKLADESVAPKGLTLTGFFGRGKRGLSTATGTLDNDITQNVALSGVTIKNGRFTASSGQGSYSLQGPETTGTFTLSGVNTTPYGDVTGVGFLSSDSEFLLYELSGSRQLIFSGVPTPSAAVPTSGVTAYNARDDFTLGGSKIPLVPFVNASNLAPATPAQAMIYWGVSGAGSHSSFFGGNLAFEGFGASQRYAFSLMVGEVLGDASGRPFLKGEGVGISSPSATTEVIGYVGPVSTQDAADGSDFFGSTGANYAVLGAEKVDDADNVVSRGIEQDANNTRTNIFPNVPLISTPSPTGLGAVRSTRVMAAYVGGVSRDSDALGNFQGVHYFDSINTTGTTVLDGVTVPVNRIQTSAAFNNVEGAFNIKSPFSDGLPATVIGFGGLGAALSKNSGFIDDGHFGAVGFDNKQPPEIDIAVFRNTDITLGAITPTGVTICTCAYVTWGIWAAGINPSTKHDIGLATWVAGERVLNSSLHQSATGTYNGTLLGTVANGTHNAVGTVSTYTAVGSYSLNVSIGSSIVNVSGGSMNIDSATMNFSGSGTISGSIPTEFTGTVSGSRGAVSLSGNIRGAFFGNPATAASAPRNVAGTFAAHDSGLTYQVSGVHFSELQQ
ncbi:MAG: FecR domain-containing protein [Proteobacteria bacterium]|nr:FecR domain-containing protein [Pseudomonadota bacterium]